MTQLPEAVRSRLEPLERTLETLETPSVLIDAGIADANLARWQERCDRAGLANRPHIKTHRTAAWALRQVELGAKGVTVQTVGGPCSLATSPSVHIRTRTQGTSAEPASRSKTWG